MRRLCRTERMHDCPMLTSDPQSNRYCVHRDAFYCQVGAVAAMSNHHGYSSEKSLSPEHRTEKTFDVVEKALDEIKKLWQ